MMTEDNDKSRRLRMFDDVERHWCHKTTAHGLTWLESTFVLGVELRIVH